MPIGSSILSDTNLLPVLAGNNTAHDAADYSDRALSGWEPILNSPDGDLIDEIPALNSRTRDLVRNNGIASSVTNTQTDNIIGNILKLVANVDYQALGWTKEKAREWNKNTENRFRSWAETTECHAARRMNLLGLARQALIGCLTNGDAVTLPLWLERPYEQWKTKLQNIESDRLKTPASEKHKDRTNGGVVSDQYGAAVAYWITKAHPGTIYQFKSIQDYADFQRIPAFTAWGRRRVIHYYNEERAGQSRGKTLFSSVIKSFKMAGMGIDYEMQSTIVNSLVSAFIESDLPDEVLARSFGNEPEKTWSSTNKKNRVTLKGGTIPVLPIGAKLNGFTPSRPNNAFEAFQKMVLKQIAAGTNMSYELLLKDFSETNYSSARATLLEVWRYFLAKREEFITGWLQPVYELWLEEAANTGRIEAPDFYRMKFAYARSRWIMSGRGWVDPVKEAKGAVIRKDAGLSTMQKECAEQGLDWEEVLDQIEIEKAEIEARNLTEYFNKNTANAYQEPAVAGEPA